MQTATEQWIQDSLERLEGLENQRAQLEGQLGESVARKTRLEDAENRLAADCAHLEEQLRQMDVRRAELDAQQRALAEAARICELRFEAIEEERVEFAVERTRVEGLHGALSATRDELAEEILGLYEALEALASAQDDDGEVSTGGRGGSEERVEAPMASQVMVPAWQAPPMPLGPVTLGAIPEPVSPDADAPVVSLAALTAGPEVDGFGAFVESPPSDPDPPSGGAWKWMAAGAAVMAAMLTAFTTSRDGGESPDPPTLRSAAVLEAEPPRGPVEPAQPGAPSQLAEGQPPTSVPAAVQDDALPAAGHDARVQRTEVKSPRKKKKRGRNHTKSRKKRSRAAQSKKGDGRTITIDRTSDPMKGAR